PHRRRHPSGSGLVKPPVRIIPELHNVRCRPGQMWRTHCNAPLPLRGLCEEKHRQVHELRFRIVLLSHFHTGFQAGCFPGVVSCKRTCCQTGEPILPRVLTSYDWRLWLGVLYLLLSWITIAWIATRDWGLFFWVGVDFSMFSSAASVFWHHGPSAAYEL